MSHWTTQDVLFSEGGFTPALFSLVELNPGGLTTLGPVHSNANLIWTKQPMSSPPRRGGLGLLSDELWSG